jgi:hypothetical protein
MTRDYGRVSQSGWTFTRPVERSNHSESAGRGGPEIEDQLARIVRDQIAVRLRKAS